MALRAVEVEDGEDVIFDAPLDEVKVGAERIAASAKTYELGGQLGEQWRTLLGD